MGRKLAIGCTTPRQICTNLCKISLSFFVLHIASEALINFYGVSESFYQDFFDAINLDEEFNLPAIYSRLLLFFCSLLLHQISIFCKKAEKRTGFFWAECFCFFPLTRFFKYMSSLLSLACVNTYIPLLHQFG